MMLRDDEYRVNPVPTVGCRPRGRPDPQAGAGRRLRGRPPASASASLTFQAGTARIWRCREGQPPGEWKGGTGECLIMGDLLRRGPSLGPKQCNQYCADSVPLAPQRQNGSTGFVDWVCGAGAGEPALEGGAHGFGGVQLGDQRRQLQVDLASSRPSALWS